MAKSIPISDTRSLSVLNTNAHQDRRKAKSNYRKIFGLDTETYNGNIFLIADSDGKILDNITSESVIKFLFSKKYQGSWNFFYNLSYDAEVILKLLGEELNTYKKTRKLLFSYDDYKLEYFPNKKFVIKKGHHSAVFFDIAQFYKTSLIEAYENNIGKLPDQYHQMKNKRKQFSTRYYNRNKIKVRNYCIQDCIFTKKLAQHWIKLFSDAFSFYPARWISSGYLAEKVLLNNEIEIPKFNTVPYDIQEFAYRTYFGGRFEILKRGFIGKAYIYDANSAYPHALTKVPNLHKGKWIQRKSIHPDAELGFFKIRACIPDLKPIPPFPFRTNNMIIFPSGQFETFVTLDEIKACDNPGFYRILDSYQFIPSTTEYPYKDFIENMYKKRLQLKQDNNPLQLPIKIILNSIYGKTGQKVNRRIGNLFNPILFSFITGYVRAQLYRFVIKNNIEKDVVSFATDSVCCTRKLNSRSKRLGDFCLEKYGDDVYVLQNGFYRINQTWQQRGLGKLGTKEIEHLDTIERNGKLYYKFKVLRNNRLRLSILQNNIKNIGKIQLIEKQINLNADQKRLWLGEINSLNEHNLNNSLPLPMAYIKKLFA